MDGVFELYHAQPEVFNAAIARVNGLFNSISIESSIKRSVGDKWTSMTATRTMVTNFTLPGKKPHGQLWNLKLDDMSDSQIAKDIPNLVFGKSLTVAQKTNLTNVISSFQASGSMMNRGDIFFYTSKNRNAQPIIGFKVKP